jgi:hypothetical protein
VAELRVASTRGEIATGAFRLGPSHHMTWVRTGPPTFVQSLLTMKRRSFPTHQFGVLSE